MNNLLEDKDASKTRAPVAKFGVSTLSGVDEHFMMKRAKANPGPGAYNRYSEFCPK